MLVLFCSVLLIHVQSNGASAQQLTVVKIDHDANPKLIEEYKVHGLPALILFTNGKEVPESRREGAIAKAKLQEYVDAFLESMPVA
ncbi:hypothetical protein ACFX19_020479 [Malus domestica]